MFQAERWQSDRPKNWMGEKEKKQGKSPLLYLSTQNIDSGDRLPLRTIKPSVETYMYLYKGREANCLKRITYSFAGIKLFHKLTIM